MRLNELITILKEFIKNMLENILKNFFILNTINTCSWKHFIYSLAVRSSSKKIFVEQDKFFNSVIPFLIILAFSGKGLSLYFARLIIIRVGNEVAAELQKK